jgi:signal transduction histidine kinase
MHLDEDIVCRGLPYEHIRLLERLKLDARDVLGLVQNVLSYSGAVDDQLVLNSGEFVLRTFFEDLQDAVGRDASDKSIAVEYPVCSADEAITGDRDKLMLVMVNLVQNAIKFTPKRGQVKVEWSLSGTGDDTRQILRVRDNGMGVPEEDLEKIFARFTRSEGGDDASRRGAGLGLAVARKLVDFHGGAIDVESKVGQGSVFSVSIPVSRT